MMNNWGSGGWELGRGIGWPIVDIEQNSSQSIESLFISQSVVIAQLLDLSQVALEIRTVISSSS